MECKWWYKVVHMNNNEIKKFKEKSGLGRNIKNM